MDRIIFVTRCTDNGASIKSENDESFENIRREEEDEGEEKKDKDKGKVISFAFSPSPSSSSSPLLSSTSLNLCSLLYSTVYTSNLQANNEMSINCSNNIFSSFSMVNVFNSINNSLNAQSRVYNNISSIHTALRSLIDDMLTDNNTHTHCVASVTTDGINSNTNIISNCNNVSSVDSDMMNMSSVKSDVTSTDTKCSQENIPTRTVTRTTPTATSTARTRTTCTFDSHIDYNNITDFTCNTTRQDCCNNKLSNSHAQDDFASFYMKSKSLKKRGANISSYKTSVISSCSLNNKIKSTFKSRVNYTCFNVSWAVTVLLMTCFTRETMQAKVDTSITLSSSAASTLPKSSSLSTLNSEFDACYNFTIGDRTKGEFYSPGYPNNYPNNTECIALITGN